MSTAAQTVATKRPIPSRVSAWKNLLGLLPYISRYKGRVTLGLLVLGAMGVVGNLLPLVIGTLIDSLSGRAAPLASSSGIARPMFSLLIIFYNPSSRQMLLLSCLALVGMVALIGVLPFSSTWLLIRGS